VPANESWKLDNEKVRFYEMKSAEKRSLRSVFAGDVRDALARTRNVEAPLNHVRDLRPAIAIPSNRHRRSGNRKLPRRRADEQQR